MAADGSISRYDSVAYRAGKGSGIAGSFVSLP